MADKQHHSQKGSNQGLRRLKSIINDGCYVFGAIHGFYDAQGTPLSEGTEFALTYGPATVRAVYSSFLPAILSGATSAAVGVGVALDKDKPNTLEVILSGSAGATLGGAAGFAVGGTYGAVVGGIKTAIGYGIGYTIGATLR